MRSLITPLAAALVIAGFLPAFAGEAEVVAIVVNKANKIDMMSARDLKQIFAGEKTRWADGGKIQMLAPSSTAAEHKVAIRFIFGMTEADYQKYCLHAVFIGEPQKVPQDSGTSEAVIHLVGQMPGAVAFVRASAATPAVKVVRIEGLAPGQPGYPISGER